MQIETVNTKPRDVLSAIERNRTIAAIALGVMLLVVTLAVYAQVGNHLFLSLDDNDYVTNNQHVLHGFTRQSVVWAFTSVESYNWHPLTWLSHMADVQFYGLNPKGHHFTNVAIHAVSTLLLFYFLFCVTQALWQSYFVAALFSLHPLHVESVAWVAERKDVLSAFFFFLTLIIYSKYVSKNTLRLYCLSLLFYVAGLMSKPMLVTLPVVMLLLDVWPLGRYRLDDEPKFSITRKAIVLIKEKIPFFFFSFLSSLITIYAQRKGGAIVELSGVPFLFRVENALIAYVKYITKIFWPEDLAVLYPLSGDISIWQAALSLMVLVSLTVMAIRLARNHPYVTTGWFWFVITLVPVIGLIQVGSQSMADRYSYLPVIGLFIIMAWGVPEMTRGLRHQQRFCALLAGVIIITVSALTWHQLGYWSDSVTLYRHTLHVTSGSTTIHYNLGSELIDKGMYDEAIQEFYKALRIDSNFADAYSGLGDAYFKKGAVDSSIREYQKSIQLNPNNATAHYNLGRAFKEKGDLDEAIREYRETFRIKPDHAKSHNSLGIVYSSKGRLDEAIQEYRHAIQIAPDNPEAHYNLGLDLVDKGDLDAAVREYREALRIDAGNVKIQQSLQAVLAIKKARSGP